MHHELPSSAQVIVGGWWLASTMNHDSSPKSGNLQRAEWRSRCRKVLSDHLTKMGPYLVKWLLLTTLEETKLDITVEPTQVRLMPGNNDEYTWQRCQGKNICPKDTYSRSN